MKTFIIAEAGSCHDGSFKKAVDLIERANEAGASAVKFQFWSSAKRLADRRNAPTYQAIYERYQVPPEWLPRLRSECDARGIEFMTTAYLPEDIEVVAQHVKRFKIASFEADDHEFIDAHRGYDRPIIVSTGMGASPPTDVLRLHCVSAYPTPVDQANLRLVQQYDYAGFSDHTRHTLTGAFAVCAGAKILEVHFREWLTQMDNPDFETALSPMELSEYIRNVRFAEMMLGDGAPGARECEAPMAAYKVRA